MKTTRKKISLLLSAACLAAFALAACSKDDGPTAPPVDTNDSTYVSADTLRAVGATVFANNCSGCHGTNGEGSHGPAVANSDFFMNNRQVIINLVLRGNTSNPPYIDSMVVNGRLVLGGGMPAWHDILTNKEIASVLTYLRSVLNDSTVVSCTSGDQPVCTKVARTPAAMAMDTVAFREVMAVRDSLKAKGVFTAP
ncbi:MAG: cbb3-type cytochrome c oxidase subunit [Fibrobacteria bacterium]|jgi:mono/diheme cytochrome c family protein|nr:cbb3-type cytochrome c oxidase subunit [Fibrobacteria bacterium]